jgi:hypothetical protein
MTKNNFILYKDFDTTLNLLNDEQAGKLFKSLFSYVNGRIEPNFKDGMLIVAFNMLKTQLERDLEKYKTRVKANQENGKLGGRPKNKPKEPTGFKKTQHNPLKAKKADSVSDSVSERDKDSNKKDKKNKQKRFVQPTIEELNNYCLERKNNVDAIRFNDHYESNGWKVGKNKMKDWKAAIRTWEKNSYNTNNKKDSNINIDEEFAKL